MGRLKNYLLELSSIGANLEQCDAIEWAIASGWVKLTYDLTTDQNTIQRNLPDIVIAWRSLIKMSNIP